MSVITALALLAIAPGPPNTRQPTLKVPAVAAPALSPNLVRMTAPVPMFVIANEKGELYLLRFKDNPRPTLPVHSTPEEAEKLRAQVSLRDPKMGARLSLRVVRLADVLNWNLDSRFPYAIALIAPPEDIIAGKKTKGFGQPDPVFPVFLIRNAKSGELLNLETKEGKIVPALFSHKEATTFAADVRKSAGGVAIQLQAVDLPILLDAVRLEKGPLNQAYKIAVPQSATEFAKKLWEASQPPVAPPGKR